MQYHKAGTEDVIHLVIGTTCSLLFKIWEVFDNDLLVSVITTLILSTVSFFVWRFWKYIVDGRFQKHITSFWDWITPKKKKGGKND